MTGIMLDFLLKASGAASPGPNEAVSLFAMLERLGYRPNDTEWTLDDLKAAFGEDGSDTIRFAQVPEVLGTICFTVLPAPWNALMNGIRDELREVVVAWGEASAAQARLLDRIGAVVSRSCAEVPHG